MIRQRTRIRYGVLLAYLLALSTSHVIASLLNLPAPSAGALAFLLCVVVQTAYEREWWR